MDPVFRDFLEALRHRRIWLRLSWMDIRVRYRRSYLGPVWLTLQSAIFILAVGTIFGLVMPGERGRYLPYFAVGYILWGLISHSAVESCELFARSRQYILQMRLPYPMWVCQLLARNLIVLAHMVPIYLGVALVYRLELGASLVLVPLGLLALLANLAWISLLLAVVCLRYRDLTRLVQSLVHVTFLASPILWSVESLGEHLYIAHLNPVFHLLEVVRAPLLGDWPLPLSWLVVTAMALLGSGLALLVYTKARQRIAFWL